MRDCRISRAPMDITVVMSQPNVFCFKLPALVIEFHQGLIRFPVKIIKWNDQDLPLRLPASDRLDSGIWHSQVACYAAEWDIVNKHLITDGVTTAHGTLVPPPLVNETPLDRVSLRGCPFSDAQMKTEK